MKPSFDLEQSRAIAAEYAAGTGCDSLAAKYGVKKWAIQTAVRRGGGVLRSNLEAMRASAVVRGLKNRKLTGERIAQAAEAYTRLGSSHRAAREMGVNTQTLLKAVRAAGVEIASVANRTYSIDEAAFEGQPGPAAAYHAGFLFADGSVQEDGSLNFALQAGDADAVVSLRSFLKAEHPIAFRDWEGPFGSGRKCCLSMYSKRLVASLARYGVVPNKTEVGEVPEFLSDNIHWWRGCIDGDGWVMMREKTPCVGFCGTRKAVGSFAGFVYRLTGKLPPVGLNNPRGTCYKSEVCGRPALALLRFLYQPGATALARKRRAAEEIMAKYPTELTFAPNKMMRVKRGGRKRKPSPVPQPV